MGQWTGSTYGSPVDGSSFHDVNTEKGAKTITYRMKVPASGRYEVRMSYVSATNRASNVPVRIEHADGSDTVIVNQRKAPAIDGLFISLGTFTFSAEKSAIITISNKNTDGIVGADVVQLIQVE